MWESIYFRIDVEKLDILLDIIKFFYTEIHLNPFQAHCILLLLAQKKNCQAKVSCQTYPSQIYSSRQYLNKKFRPAKGHHLQFHQEKGSGQDLRHATYNVHTTSSTRLTIYINLGSKDRGEVNP